MVTQVSYGHVNLSCFPAVSFFSNGELFAIVLLNSDIQLNTVYDSFLS